MTSHADPVGRIDLADPRASAVAKKTFFRIMDLWGATNEQAQVLLGSPARILIMRAAVARDVGGPTDRDRSVGQNVFRTVEPKTQFDLRTYIGRLAAELHDIRGGWPEVHDPSSYDPDSGPLAGIAG